MKTKEIVKHTEGPWIIEEPSKGFNGYVIQGPITKTSFGEELAELRCWEDRPDQNAQQEANARKTQARLLNEGLPAFRQLLETAKGSRIRVRVGPYASAKEAGAAATRIRGLQLEAVVFKQ